MIRGTLRLLRRLRRSRAGIAAVEFALVMPVLMTLYLVGNVLSDAIACNRKVTTTARTIADLSSRYISLSSSDVTTILAASTQVMAPYSAANASLAVSEVQVTGSTTATVVWTRTQNGTARAAGATIAIPANLAAVGSYLIVGEVSYPYNPGISWGVFNGFTLADTSIMVPRASDQVPLN